VTEKHPLRYLAFQAFFFWLLVPGSLMGNDALPSHTDQNERPLESQEGIPRGDCSPLLALPGFNVPLGVGEALHLAKERELPFVLLEWEGDPNKHLLLLGEAHFQQKATLHDRARVIAAADQRGVELLPTQRYRVAPLLQPFFSLVSSACKVFTSGSSSIFSCFIVPSRGPKSALDYVEGLIQIYAKYRFRLTANHELYLSLSVNSARAWLFDFLFREKGMKELLPFSMEALSAAFSLAERTNPTRRFTSQSDFSPSPESGLSDVEFLEAAHYPSRTAEAGLASLLLQSFGGVSILFALSSLSMDAPHSLYWAPALVMGGGALLIDSAAAVVARTSSSLYRSILNKSFASRFLQERDEAMASAIIHSMNDPKVRFHVSVMGLLHLSGVTNGLLKNPKIRVLKARDTDPFWIPK
jgi:hypothetical protein